MYVWKFIALRVEVLTDSHSISIFFIRIFPDLVHVTCRARSDAPKSDIEPYEQLLFNADADDHDVLWSMYFNIPSCRQCIDSVKSPANSFVACGPYFELDYDESIRMAKKLFTQIYGTEEEFLPRAPDPEEIIIEGDNATDPPAWIVADLNELSAESSNTQTNETESTETETPNDTADAQQRIEPTQ